MEQLWVDKYIPKQLSEFKYNQDSVEILKKLSKNSNDLPHLIIEGISGIGKKAMAMAFIKDCIDQFGFNGSDVYKTNYLDIELKYTNKKIDLNIQKSLYHYNLNPSDYGIYDRHIVQDFLKTQFKYKTLTGFPYKNVIIRNAEDLSHDAQQSLRRTLENCIKNCRFIFMVNTEKQGNLIMALNSRCIRIKLSSPTPNQSLNVIRPILDQEGVKINDKLIKNLFKKCQGNLSKTINFLQLMSITMSQDQLNKQTVINMSEICPVTKTCNDIVVRMFTGTNLSLITEIRNYLYILLTHGVNSEDIVKRIFKIVIRNLVGWESRVIEITDEIELKLTKSSREFYHLEKYLVKLLLIIKEYQMKKPSEPKKKTKLNFKKNGKTKKIENQEKTSNNANQKTSNNADQKTLNNETKSLDVKESKKTAEQPKKKLMLKKKLNSI